MLSRLRMILAIPELRQKFVITLILLAVYRMGFSIPLPFVNQEEFAATFKKLQQQQGIGQVMQAVALLSASRLGNATIFGLGIMPYISASIIFQLLGQVYPPLEQLQKEGESGRKKINEYTRYATVLICLGQSYFWINMLASGRLGGGLILEDYNTFFFQIIATITMTAGTLLLMWIGEQIDEYGVGNGISLLIMAGILAQMPAAGLELLRPALNGGGIGLGTAAGIDKLMPLAVLFVAVVLAVIAITQAQRRIPIQSAKHVRGRRVLGGQMQFLPLRVNQAGVMPIIFASSLLMIPAAAITWSRSLFPENAVLVTLDSAFNGGGRGLLYNLFYVALIYFFCYFWTSITFNPKDMAENLKDYGSFVPGYRPGSHTEKYLDQVMVRITYVGAGFLALIAITPTVIASSMDISYMVASFYGGTGLLIVVSVALDLVQKIDSHLVMRNKPGLLDSDAS
ncbi:preprotein translocase subunit SecY [Planctomicrobium piriforme]|uniref:Protein translocase subunit SecY n=1 Tax=Planctomicrobium piriforme TaxID=1576369 RepID=A0A1I3C7B9_9PLAN|nr:preprotein translocase subunit SecY [Planctomicrobium piriforme]SFH70206.1 preprotein translocase subunit SecY [Planctomicrobium piriforme]